MPDWTDGWPLAMTGRKHEALRRAYLMPKQTRRVSRILGSFDRFENDDGEIGEVGRTITRESPTIYLFSQSYPF